MADAASPLVLDQAGGNVALDLFVLTERVGTLLADTLSGTGVSPSQYAVYAQLLQRPRTPSELSDLVGIPRSTLSGYLATLNRRGDIHRERSSGDGRSWVIELTPEGRVRAQQCRPRIRRAIKAVNGRLGEAAEIAATRHTLGRIDIAVREAHLRPERAELNLADTDRLTYFLTMRSNMEGGATFTQVARRAQLIDAAIDVLSADGYQAASLAAIASRVGVSKGVVSYHFAGKDELLGQVVAEIYGAAGAAIAARVGAAADPVGQLRAYVEANLEYVGEHRHQIRALMEIVSNARDGRGRLRFSPPANDPLVAHLSQLLVSGQEAGHFRPVDAHALALIVRGLIDTASARLVYDPAFDLGAYTAEVVRVVDAATCRLEGDAQ